MRLGAILDHLQPVPRRNLHQRVQIDALAVQVNRHDRLGLRRNRRLDLADVHQEIVVPDIDENRAGAENLDGRNRRHRGVRHRDDLVARANPRRRQRDIDRVGTAVDTDAAIHPDIGRHRAFEGDTFRPENELAGSEDTIDRGENLVAQLIVLASVVPIWR